MEQFGIVTVQNCTGVSFSVLIVRNAAIGTHCLSPLHCPNGVWIDLD